MLNSNMFQTVPEGFRLATDSLMDVKLVSLTIAQAFAECNYPCPTTDFGYDNLLRHNYKIGEICTKNALEFGNVLVNEDYSAIMLVVPYTHAAKWPIDELAAEMAEYATPADAENFLAIFNYIGEDEKTLVVPENAIYIEIIAVQPQRQGKKEASRLIRALFTECEKEGRDVFLFTNTEINEKIYAHFGFETILEHTVEELKSTTYYMVRRCPSAE